MIWSTQADLGIHCPHDVTPICNRLHPYYTPIPLTILVLTFIALWANSADKTLLYLFSYFFVENDIWLHANCLQWRQYSWNIKAYFSGKYRKTRSKCCPLKILTQHVKLSRKHAYIILTPLTRLLYSKTGVYRGIHYFSYFCSKT